MGHKVNKAMRVQGELLAGLLKDWGGELPSPSLSLSESVKRRAENPPQSQPTGWRCPKCGRGNSPYVTTCPCGPDIQPSTAGTSGETWIGTARSSGKNWADVGGAK